jgi:hypothetical protein
VAIPPREVVSVVDGTKAEGTPAAADGARDGTGDGAFEGALAPDANTAPAPMTRPRTSALAVVPRTRKRGCDDISGAFLC